MCGLLTNFLRESWVGVAILRVRDYPALPDENIMCANTKTTWFSSRSACIFCHLR